MYANKYGIEKDISTNRDLTESYESTEPNYHVPIFSARSRLMNVAWIIFDTSSCSIDRPIDREGTNERHDANKYAPLCDQSI